MADSRRSTPYLANMIASSALVRRRNFSIQLPDECWHRYGTHMFATHEEKALLKETEHGAGMEVCPCDLPAFQSLYSWGCWQMQHPDAYAPAGVLCRASTGNAAPRPAGGRSGEGSWRGPCRRPARAAVKRTQAPDRCECLSGHVHSAAASYQSISHVLASSEKAASSACA